MNGHDIHHLAAAYALDAVDERERAEFERHQAECPVCRPDVAGFRETLSHLAASAATTPPASLRAGVMNEIATTRQLPPLERRTGTTPLHGSPARLRVLALAAALLLVVGGAFVLGRSSQNSSTSTAAEVFARPDTRITDLRGSVSGTFRVAWSPSLGRAVVIGDGLAPATTGKAYELWAIDDSGAHAMRLLDPAARGHIERVLDVKTPPATWAVTVEPAAGVDKATTSPIFTGAV
jgi:anti-sigma-K factor RskA